MYFYAKNRNRLYFGNLKKIYILHLILFFNVIINQIVKDTPGLTIQCIIVFLFKIVFQYLPFENQLDNSLKSGAFLI